MPWKATLPAESEMVTFNAGTDPNAPATVKKMIVNKEVRIRCFMARKYHSSAVSGKYYFGGERQVQPEFAPSAFSAKLTFASRTDAPKNLSAWEWLNDFRSISSGRRGPAICACPRSGVHRHFAPKPLRLSLPAPTGQADCSQVS